MQTPEQVKADFYAYLDQKFGSGFSALITPPEEVEIGERALYILANGRKAQRANMERANWEFENEIEDLANELAGEFPGLQYSVDLATSSGLPYPRAVDIPGASDLALGWLAGAYAKSAEELPAPGFPLCWLLGVIFTPSAKYLLYLDFMHPRLRALYVAEYDVEMEFFKGRDIPQQFRFFAAQQAEMVAVVEGRPDIRWAKLVQVDGAIWTSVQSNHKFEQQQSVGNA